MPIEYEPGQRQQLQQGLEELQARQKARQEARVAFEGTEFTAGPQVFKSKAYEHFVEKYTRWLGHEPDEPTAHAIAQDVIDTAAESAALTAQRLVQLGIEPQAVADYLANAAHAA